MKLRHAAAFALIGWYLMVPPSPRVSIGDTQAPIREWTRKSAFDIESECKQKISKGCYTFQSGEEFGFEGPLCNAQCVESTDPRLAK
jgi:hypothetical protein